MSDIRRAAALTPQAVLGLCAVLFGLILTADNIGWLNAGSLLRFWPLSLVAVGLAMLLQPETQNRRVTAWIVLIAGLWMTAQFVYRVPWSIFDWWPLVIVAMGIVMIRRSRERVATGAVSGDQAVSAFAVWSGIQRRISSPAFRRADLAAVMGGIEIDLRQASTAGGDAIIDLFAMWGGIEITVPTDWEVSNQVLAIMGGVEDKSSGMQGAKHKLIIRGFVLMGGVEIKT